MKILYGVAGDGMGHAVRSRVVIDRLLTVGHEVAVVSSDRAYAFLRNTFADRPRFSAVELVGLKLAYRGDAVDEGSTLVRTIASAPLGLPRNLSACRRLAARFRPDVVISDFETSAGLFGRYFGMPILSIDNLQMLDRCRHDHEVRGPALRFRMARTFVSIRLPPCRTYFVATFFHPPLAKPRTTLVPPILRREILDAKREPGDHVLVYQTAATNAALVPTLKRLPGRFRVYGMGRTGEEGNVSLREFAEAGFVEDLRTARAVVAGGGFSLMSEAVHLRVPMLSIPLRNQAEQRLNAGYLAKLGYGARAEAATPDVIEAFLARVDDHQHALGRFASEDNSRLFAALDAELAQLGAS